MYSLKITRKQKYFRYHIIQRIINTIFIYGENLHTLAKSNELRICEGSGSDKESLVLKDVYNQVDILSYNIIDGSFWLPNKDLS